MKKYEIFTDTFEFHFSKPSIPAMTAEEIFQTYWSCDTRITSNCLDPRRECSFDTKEEALAEWEKNYKDYGRTWESKGWAVYLLCGEMAWLEENEYDEDGNFDYGGDTWLYSVEPNEKEGA